ncbi:hypothetical protein NUM3379_19890 [Kineococcus sp. NUM-3379]
MGVDLSKGHEEHRPGQTPVPPAAVTWDVAREAAALREVGRDAAEVARQAAREIAEVARQAGRQAAEAGRQAGREAAEAGKQAGRQAAEAGKQAAQAGRQAGREAGAAAKEARALARVAPAAVAAPGAHPARGCARGAGLDLPRIGHVSGATVHAVHTFWLFAWIALFAMGIPQLALPVMFLWIAAGAVQGRYAADRRREQRLAAPPAPPPAQQLPSAPPPLSEGARATQEFSRAVRTALQAAAHLPPGALDRVRDLDAVVRPLLARAAEPGVDPRAVHDLHALAGEYLPQAVHGFLRLPPEVAASRTASTGTTPAEDFTEQLRLLHEGAVRLRAAVHGADAERLATQRRFLEAKFRRSDLDL